MKPGAAGWIDHTKAPAPTVSFWLNVPRSKWVETLQHEQPRMSGSQFGGARKVGRQDTDTEGR